MGLSSIKRNIEHYTDALFGELRWLTHDNMYNFNTVILHKDYPGYPRLRAFESIMKMKIKFYETL